MPTNRARMPGKTDNRSAALFKYQAAANILPPAGGHMGGLNARFSSFANTIQTRLNSATGTNGSLGGTLEAQVNGALSQILRQSGNGTTTAVAARPGDNGIAALVGGAGGVQPAMSPYQATLLREARITQADFLALLDSLQPLSPFTDPGDAECVRSLVRAEVNGLLEEFAYTRLQPRQQRVRVFLGALLGYDYDAYSGVSSPIGAAAPPGDIQTLVNLFNLGGPIIPTIAVEDQLATQQALGTDAAQFDAQWSTFWRLAVQGSPQGVAGPAAVPWPLWEWPLGSPVTLPTSGGLGTLLRSPAAYNLIPFGPGGPQLANQASWQVGVIQNPAKTDTPGQSYTERMIKADLLLPVIAQDASRVENDLTAVGFTAGEQETRFAWLWSAVDADLLPPYNSAANVPPVPATSGWTVLAGALQTLNPIPGQPLVPGTTPTPIPVWTTVADILDWAQNLTGPTSADYLRQAGALGLNLICDQADELFWLVLAMLDPSASNQLPGVADAEVQLDLAALATDLNTLANLAY